MQKMRDSANQRYWNVRISVILALLKMRISEDKMFRRKVYDKLLAWKEKSNGDTALLLEGARRVGKSTIVEEFAKKEYRSYIRIDFAEAPLDVRRLFDDVSDLDYLFLQLQLRYQTQLHRRASLIIFDEVQLCPLARQAIKTLVKDGRYDYIETGRSSRFARTPQASSYRARRSACRCAPWTSKSSVGLVGTKRLSLFSGPHLQQEPASEMTSIES